MRKRWVADCRRGTFWREAFRVAKPGAHLLAFGGTRTYHRLACAIEDAGWEIRDCLVWAYASGFPKSLDVSKAIDKAAGAEREKVAVGSPVKRMIPGADQNSTGSWIKDNGREYQPGVEVPATDAARQWEGWGTALKPAWEPIVMARKPLRGTVAANVTRYGTGALNIDATRIGTRLSAMSSRATTDVAGTSWGEGEHARALRGAGRGWSLARRTSSSPIPSSTAAWTAWWGAGRRSRALQRRGRRGRDRAAAPAGPPSMVWETASRSSMATAAPTPASSLCPRLALGPRAIDPPDGWRHPTG